MRLTVLYIVLGGACIFDSDLRAGHYSRKATGSITKIVSAKVCHEMNEISLINVPRVCDVAAGLEIIKHD